MKLYVFDDARADAWAPFALSRPCGELRFGSSLLRERLETFAGVPASGHITRPWLDGYAEDGAPPVLAPGRLDEDEPRLLLCSRAVPAMDARAERSLPRDGHEAVTLMVDGQVAGALLPAGAPTPDPGWLRHPEAVPGAAEIHVEGRLLERVWDLVADHRDRLWRELEAEASRPTAALPEGVVRLGDGPVLLGRDVRLEPGVLLDTRDGPIRLDDGVDVLAGARLGGPLHAGSHSRLLGGPIACLSAGAFSYLRGEIEETVVLGHTNKAHAGFLGHAYLGRWVNLGASTTNSDLKNNYGPVRVGPPGREEDTGLLKLGCLLGDHVKTGIGTLLDTGTVVGTGSNLFGGDLPPKWVPPFSWGRGAELVEYRKEAFLRTAETVMGRREVELGEEGRAWLAAIWEAGREAGS